MSIKRFVADADTTITNAYKANLTQRGTGSNMGASDILEMFSIYGQQDSGSSELSRILIKFPVTDIQTARTNGQIPASGSCSFYLRMFNAPHGQTLPKDTTAIIQPISRSWDEGYGLDMEDYSDRDAANWEYATSNITWTSNGGDYLSSPTYSASFATGLEDVSVDISPLVEQWISGTTNNYGVGLRLTSSLENDSNSYYTKKFFARRSENYMQRPVIEVRWDSSRKDNRGNFYASSSLASAADNTMTLYFYNYVKGQLQNIPAIGTTGSIYLKLFTSASSGTDLTPTAITGGYVSTGIYSASFAVSTTASYCYDRWYVSGTSSCIHTGSQIIINQLDSSNINPSEKWVTNITNLKLAYTGSEVARLRVFTRKRNYQQNVYTIFNQTIRPDIVENAYYSVWRQNDNLEVIPYGTGSIPYTKLSYDASGSYFDLDMSLFEPEYFYKIKFAYYINGNYEEQPEQFKFKVL